MEYTIFQMLLSLFLSGVLGLLVGFVLRGGSGQGRARDLEHRLAEAEADADSHRSEAARLAAELQSRAFSGSGDATATVRLEGDLKRARAELDGLGAQNAELRAYVADLERRLAHAEAAASREPASAETDENAAAWRAHALSLETRLAELEPAAQDAAELRAEVDALRAQLADRGAFGGEALATGVSEDGLAALAEVEDLRSRLAQAEDVASAVTADAERLRARIDELEAAAEGAGMAIVAPFAGAGDLDALRADLAAAIARADSAEARAAAFDAAGSAEPPGEDDEQRLYWLTARNRWLERKLDEARAALGAAPAEVVEADRARMEQLSGDLAAARADVERLSGELTAARSALDAARAAAPARLAIATAANGEAANAADTDGDSDGDGGAEAVAELARLRWRNRYLASRVKYLESKTAEAEAAAQAAVAAPSRVVSLDEAAGVSPFAGAEAPGELEQLRKRVHELESAATAASAEGGENYSLEWRNRYLASRVRYLEQRLAEQDAPAEGAPAASPGAAPLASATGGDAEELARLRARVVELETLSGADASALRNRVAELEGELAARRDAEADTQEGRGDGDYALEWRNRYLTSRVKYLEERLAEYRARTEVDA